MNSKELIKKIESLYGQYNGAQFDVVQIWLDKYPGDLMQLYAEVLKTVSWQYKTPPGPAEFEAIKKDIIKAGMEAQRPELQEHQPLQIEESERPTPEQIEAGFAAMKNAIKKSNTVLIKKGNKQNIS